MTEAAPNTVDWTPITGRLMAATLLHLAGMVDKSVVEKAEFLMALGVPRADAAVIIGSSDNSLRVMLGQKARRAGAAKSKTSAT